MIGDWVLRIGLPLYIYSRTGSTLATGALVVVRTLVILLLIANTLNIAADVAAMGEAAELVKQLEGKWGVSAAAAAVAAAPAAAAAAPVEEKTEFTVVLAKTGDKKIDVIKVIRELTGLGLKEAKDLVDGAPKPVIEKASKEDAEKAKAKLEESGAQVEMK